MCSTTVRGWKEELRKEVPEPGGEREGGGTDMEGGKLTIREVRETDLSNK